jgi:hypothetical protein
VEGGDNYSDGADDVADEDEDEEDDGMDDLGRELEDSELKTSPPQT